MINETWKLGKEESISDCVSPSGDPWDLPVCIECGQAAYRLVIVVSSGAAKRKVPLCGRHFISACLRVPELNRYNRGGKIG